MGTGCSDLDYKISVVTAMGGPGKTCDRREESDPLMIVNLTLGFNRER